MLKDSENRAVFPGDVIRDIKSVKGVTILGPGLHQNESELNSVRVTRSGSLHFKPPNVYWVEHDQKRYIPKRGDLVVGIVVKKSGDLLKIDIGASEPASLSMLAFEGATKKQKPDLQVGDLVYGKLLNAHKEMEPELVCVDSYFKAGKLGPLSNDGFVVTASLGLVYRLLDPENPILETLGKLFPFEIAVGMNGKVWVNAKSVKDVLTVIRCLEVAEAQDDKTVLDLCKQFK
ncbi:exosome complex component RRP40 [Tribolium madens]|uniref:exosome complex component RRP40 n=1 Tax=Tribolium madens TaxID=41895 RepID=UPI001CF74690|nr:exosome complex component RRP40 [Tribolium madens]